MRAKRGGRLIRAPGSPHIGQGVHEVIGDHRGGYLLSLSKEVVRHDPVVAAQVNRDHRALVDIARACEPRHEAVIDGPVRIEEEKPALAALPPVQDVLADEVLEELRLAAPGRAGHIEMPAPLLFREDERLAVSARGDKQVVTGRSSHKPHRAPRSGGGVQDEPDLCLNDEKRASGQIEGLDGVFPNRVPVGLFCVPRMYFLCPLPVKFTPTAAEGYRQTPIAVCKCLLFVVVFEWYGT
jgi:hypothetical protein